MPNPLSTAPPKGPNHPAMNHAKAWQHVNTMAPDTIPAKITQMDALIPVFGALASKPNVTPKDVIKAAADAAARGIATPSEAVKFISGMPSAPDALNPWLRNLYETNLSAQIHMKAAMLKQSQMQQQQAQQAAMPQPGAAPQGMPPQGIPQ